MSLIIVGTEIKYLIKYGLRKTKLEIIIAVLKSLFDLKTNKK